MHRTMEVQSLLSGRHLNVAKNTPLNVDREEEEQKRKRSVWFIF